MTTLEKAYNALTILLCQTIAERDEQLERLQKELDGRPTREELTAGHQRELRLGDELRAAQRRVIDLESSLNGGRRLKK